MRQLIALLACFLLCLPALADGYSGGGSPAPTGTTNQVVVTGTSPPVLSLPNNVIIPNVNLYGSTSSPSITVGNNTSGSASSAITVVTPANGTSTLTLGPGEGTAGTCVLNMTGTTGATLHLYDGAGILNFWNAANTLRTALTATAPTGINSIALPNASGTVVLSGANSNLTSLTGLTGTIVMAGASSGTCTVGVPAAAGDTFYHNC